VFADNKLELVCSVWPSNCSNLANRNNLFSFYLFRLQILVSRCTPKMILAVV